MSKSGRLNLELTQDDMAIQPKVVPENNYRLTPRVDVTINGNSAETIMANYSRYALQLAIAKALKINIDDVEVN